MNGSDHQPGYQVGDVLRVRCEEVTARVAKVTPSYAMIEWPWAAVDPDSQYAWNGEVAFPVDPASHEWWLSPFLTDPEPRHLAAGDTCRIGVRDTPVRVLGVDRHDPPADTGWLPRPRTTLTVAFVDAPPTEEAAEEGEGFTIEVGSFAPLEFELVARD